MAAALVRQSSGQRFRSGRFRGRHGSGEENIQLDFTKDPLENVKEILSYVIKQQAYSKAKKLGYLNVFVKLIDKCGGSANLGFPLRSILICLSINLINAPKEVRAGTLRAIKHLINDEESLQVLLDLHLDYLIARSLDMCLDNEIERIHAQKLMRKFTTELPGKMPTSLVHPLVAIGQDGASERDRMVRASLACICELTYSNPDLVAHCGGISMLLRKILDCPLYPRINESLVATILHLVNYPSTRHFIRFNTDLEQLIAPFTDCHFSYTGEISDQTSEDREARFAASRMAVITVLRSWPGIIRFCGPGGTGLQSLVGILYLPYIEIRQALLEMVFELFHLTLPDSTTDFSQALVSIDPSRMRENWHLTEGFVANEGKTILPHTATFRPNLVENHMALLLSTFIGAGILDALVEVIISSKDELFIRAVILLANLLHLANRLLPPECSHHSHYLPSLMALASSFDITETQRHQASVAVSYLYRLHVLNRRGPIPCSLYLDQLIKQSGVYRDRPQSLSIQKDKFLDINIRKRASSSEEVCMQTLKDTQVLATKENKNWDWDLIEYILKWPDDRLRRLEDQSHLRFVKRLVFFFKPTNHLFSRIEVEHEFQRKFALAGCHLVDFLVKCDQDDGGRLLADYLADIALCLNEVAQQRIASESVLSASNVINTLSHYYFLFIGRFSMSSKGDRLLEKSGIYQHFLDIISSAPQECYIKLITSCLFYGRDGNSRTILSKALCAGSEAGRLYSTKLMRVLLRAKVHEFSQWGIELLVGQLYDQSRSVAMIALTILDEACEVKENLESVVKMKPSFLHLGEKGVMILCRYMSTTAGFKFLTEANYTMNELKKWHATFNTRYVKIVEELLNEALTTYEKTYEGSYTRRSSKRRQRKDVFIPTHLYGQLVQHKEGFELLKQQSYMEDYFQCIRYQVLKDDEDVLLLKTALWAVGHISMSSWGVAWLQEEKLVPEIIRLAEESAIYSIRGTAFFILGLVSSTREGAELLSQYGWESRWNTRAEKWPLVEDRAILLDNSMEDLRSEAAFSMGGTRMELGSPVSNLDFIAEEQFVLGTPGKSRSAKEGVDKQDDGDSDDSESGIHIPDITSGTNSHSPETRRNNEGIRLKSQTLPVPGRGVSRSHTLPFRSHTFRSIALPHLPHFRRHRTKSFEHVSSPTKEKDFTISQEQRSQSVNLHKSLTDSHHTSTVISAVQGSKSSETVLHSSANQSSALPSKHSSVSQESPSKHSSAGQVLPNKHSNASQQVSNRYSNAIDSSLKTHSSDVSEVSTKETGALHKSSAHSSALNQSSSASYESSSHSSAFHQSTLHSSASYERTRAHSWNNQGDWNTREIKIVNKLVEQVKQSDDGIGVSNRNMPEKQEDKVMPFATITQNFSGLSVSDTSNDDVLLKIVEQGDEGYKSDSKTESSDSVKQHLSNIFDPHLIQKMNHTQSMEKTSGIEISVIDTDNDFNEKPNEIHFEASRKLPLKGAGKSNQDVVDKQEKELGENVYKHNLELEQREVRSLETKDETRRSTKKVGILKEERSSSSDSSRTSYRTESFNTDSATSGVGSYDSGHHGGIEFRSLSPIASTNSLDTAEVQMRHKEKKDQHLHHKEAHHSHFLRRLSNLSRIPSLRKPTSPGLNLFPSSRPFDFSENAIMYTTARDAIGYATLRSLMKTRTISSDVESDYGLNNLYDNMGSVTSLNRRASIDSTSDVRRPRSLIYNLSGISLSEMDNPLHPQKAHLYQQRPHTGKAEFMGIALPVDINMLFEVHEGEDKRTTSFSGSAVSRQGSLVSEPAFLRHTSFGEHTSELKMARSESGTDNSLDSRISRSRAQSNVEMTLQPLSSTHNVDACIQCRGLSQETAIIHPIEESDGASDKGENSGMMEKLGRTSNRPRGFSFNDILADTPSSVTSTGSDSPVKKVSFDSPVGRTLVRKEIIRFVINLSSSVGVKGAEQGLLSLKQKFPRAFQDLCFYSEVSHMLGTCSFRLTARRFIQELFEDLDITKLLEEARNILGVEEILEKAAQERSFSEDFDGFDDFS